MPTIEIEERAPVSSEQRDAILAQMRGLGDVQEVNRVMIDFSVPHETRMLRFSNGVPEWTVKPGGVTANVRPTTSELLDVNAPLPTLLGRLARQGHTQAMVGRRQLSIVVRNDLEYSMRDVIDTATGKRVSTIIEAEVLLPQPGHEEADRQRAKRALATLGLSVFSELEWLTWVARIHATVDQPFSYSPENAQALATSDNSY